MAAAKRWPRRHGPRCAALRPVHLGDDLYACQPICQAMLDRGGDFLPAAKPASHKTLYEYLRGIDPHTACELAETLWQQARQRLGARQRLFEHLRSITAYQVFPTWTAPMTLLATGHAPPRPP